MSEMAREELLNRIRGLSEEEKILVANELPINLLMSTLDRKVKLLEYIVEDTRSIVNATINISQKNHLS